MKNDMLQYVLKKAAEIILTLLIVTLLSFLLMRLSPIDPATAYVKRNTPIVTEEQIQVARVQMGLDQPLPVQYGKWVKNALHLDFGISLGSGYPVWEEISEALPITLTIVFLAAVIMGLGIIAFGCLNFFLRDHVAGYLLICLYIAGISIPPFYLASLYIDVFALKLDWMTVAGNTGFSRYFPPALCLSVLGIALYSQLLSKGMEREMNEDYAFYARCRGLSESRILLFHALPHAIAAVIPSFLQMLGLFMAGAVIVESVFSLPGIGHLIINSVIERDSPMIHAEVLILALSFVIFNVLSDILQRCLQGDKEEQEGGCV